MSKSECLVIFLGWVFAAILLGGCANIERSGGAHHFERSLELMGHTMAVPSVAWNHDGTRLAAAGQASSSSDSVTVRIWDAMTGRQELGISAHATDKYNGMPLPVTMSVAWSPDGRRLATCGIETIRVWDAATGREELFLHGEGGKSVAANTVKWSPDGRYLASGGSDGAIRLWSAMDGKPDKILRGHKDDIGSVAWSPDGSKIASCSADMTVRLWNVSTGQEERVLSGHASKVNSVAWSPDGNWVASGGNDDVIRIWYAMTGVKKSNYQGNVSPGDPFPGIIFSVAWRPDGEVLAFGGADGTVRLLNLKSGLLEEVLRGHYGEVLSVAWSRDGRRLASSDFNGKVFIWESMGR